MPTYPTNDRPAAEDFLAAGYDVIEHDIYVLLARDKNIFAVQHGNVELAFVPEETGWLLSTPNLPRKVVISGTSEALEEYVGYVRQEPSVVAVEKTPGSGEFIKCTPLDARTVHRED